MAASPGHEPRRRARRRVLQALYQWQITAQPAAEILRQFRARQDFSEVDEPFFEQALCGVIEHCADLDARLQLCLDRPMEHLDMIERAILRLGAWELLHCPGTPGRVVLNEAIDLAHRFGAEQGHTYVNAVLDKSARALRPQEFAGAP